jgi:hypothetical protein
LRIRRQDQPVVLATRGSGKAKARVAGTGWSRRQGPQEGDRVAALSITGTSCGKGFSLTATIVSPYETAIHQVDAGWSPRPRRLGLCHPPKLVRGALAGLCDAPIGTLRRLW